MTHPNSTTCWGLTIAILGVIAGGLAIGFAAWNGLATETGLVNEADFSFPLSVWALTWGIVIIVAIIAYAIDVWRRNREQTVRAPDCLSWFWTVLMVFLILPWNIIGHIFLVRAWASLSSSSSALYGMSIAALVISWIVFLVAIFFILKVLFVHNWQIGMSRRYLMEISDSQRDTAFPLLPERARVLPAVMVSMDTEKDK